MNKTETNIQKGVSTADLDLGPAKCLLCPATKNAKPIQIDGSIISRCMLCPANLLSYVGSGYAPECSLIFLVQLYTLYVVAKSSYAYLSYHILYIMLSSRSSNYGQTEILLNCGKLISITIRLHHCLFV